MVAVNRGRCLLPKVGPARGQWLRLNRQDLRKLLSESANRSRTFFRCYAVARLEDTLDQSSVVGYKCKAIQWLVLSQQVETPARGKITCVQRPRSGPKMDPVAHPGHSAISPARADTLSRVTLCLLPHLVLKLNTYCFLDAKILKVLQEKEVANWVVLRCLRLLVLICVWVLLNVCLAGCCACI